MSNAAAYRLLFLMVLFVVPYELLLAFGPGVDSEFQGYWQVWHPYFLPLLGLLLVPMMFGYVLPLARRLGGRTTVWGRSIWFLSAGILSYTVLGTSLIFLEMTCGTWERFACDNPVGFIPHPSLGSIGFVLMYPLVTIGLVAMLQGLGSTVASELRRHWWAPLLVAITLVAFAAPFALDLAYHPDESMGGIVVDTLLLVGSGVVVSIAAVAVGQASQLSGGGMRRPVYFQLAGLLVLGASAMITVHVNTVGREFTSTDPSTVPHTVGFVLWLISFLMIGATLERLLGLDRGADESAERGA
jgi:hypothetical protein